MALLFMDGFDHLSVAQLTVGKWDTGSGISIETTIVQYSTGQSIQDAANGYVEKSFGSNLAAGCLGVGYRCAALAGANPIFILYDGTTIQMGLIRNSNGSLSVCRGTSATVLGTSATGLISANTWYYIELKWKINDSISSGDVVVYIDGVSVLTVAATSDTKATANAYATKYHVGGDSAFYNSTVDRRYFDNHYSIDFSGSSNNTPLGSVRVQTLYPNGNGNTSGMTNQNGNSTNNYQQVDETGSHNSDTDYVEASTASTKDTYAFQNTAATTGTIFGVQTNITARRTDANAKTICPVVRHSSTDYDGTTTASINSNFQTYSQMYETNPGTSAAWTQSDVDGAEFGVKVVS